MVREEEVYIFMEGVFATDRDYFGEIFRGFLDFPEVGNYGYVEGTGLAYF